MIKLGLGSMSMALGVSWIGDKRMGLGRLEAVLLRSLFFFIVFKDGMV